MLFIDNQTVQQILTIDDAINSQDVAFRGLVDGAAIHRPRIDMYVPTGREDDYYRWGTMEGASRDLGVFAIRMKSDVVSWPEDENGNWTEEKLLRRARHLLRADLPVQHRQRRTARHHQRRRTAAHARRRWRRARRALPLSGGLARRGDARLGRMARDVPQSVLQRAPHREGARLQPHETAIARRTPPR